MVTLRTASVDDMEAMLELDAAGFHDTYPWGVMRQFLDIAGDLAVVAEEGGVVVGYALGALGATGVTGWLLSAAVAPEARHRAIGASLGAEVMRRLRLRGVREIVLTVRPDNEPMIRWCRSAGFLCVADEPHYFGPGERRLVMRRLSDNLGEKI